MDLDFDEPEADKDDPGVVADAVIVNSGSAVEEVLKVDVEMVLLLVTVAKTSLSESCVSVISAW